MCSHCNTFDKTIRLYCWTKNLIQERNGILKDFRKEASFLFLLQSLCSTAVHDSPSFLFAQGPAAHSAVPQDLSSHCILGGNWQHKAPRFPRPCESFKAGVTFQQTMLEGASSITFFFDLLWDFSHTTWTWQTSYSLLCKWNVMVMHTIVEYDFQYVFDDKDLVEGCLKLYYLRQ